MCWIPEKLPEVCANNTASTICQSSTFLFLKLIHDLFGSSRCKTRPQEFVAKEYDFIIVGGGSAGCVLANRLSEVKKWNVLLLEAGVEEPMVTNVPAFANILQRSNVDWDFKAQEENTSCLLSKGCTWAYGKVLGGSSAISGMLYVRGNRIDYDNWAKLGNLGWHYKDVLPYFKKSEDNRDEEIVRNNPNYHNAGGYHSVETISHQDLNTKNLIKAANEMGYKTLDVNGEEQIGAMFLQTTSNNGKRQSANKAFLQPVRTNRKNLKIITEAYVTKILIDPKTKKAYGVKYTSTASNLTKIVKVKKEIILSAGAIKSPQLLMLSGIGPIEELREHNIEVLQNSSVGMNLQDHVTFAGIYIILDNKTWPKIKFDEKKEDLRNYLNSQKGPLSSIGPQILSIFSQTKYETQDAPDLQLLFIGTNIAELDLSPIMSYYDSILLYPTLLTPKSRGVIKLNKTNPIWGSPVIVPQYLTNQADVNRMLEGIRMCLQFFETKTFVDNNYRLYDTPEPPCDKFKWNSDEYWICLLRAKTVPGSHAAGSCKMGPKSDPDAVVDSRLRVYGIRRLRVVDASIMPIIPRGNTHAPTVMIAEKASDLIKEDWYVN